MTEPQAQAEEKQGAEEALMPPAEKEEEEPTFNLMDILRGRGKPAFAANEVMAYAILADIMDRREDRREERMWRRQMLTANPSSKPNPEVEALKAEVAQLRQTVSELLETIRNQQQQEAQKKFVEGVVKQTTDIIMPELEVVKQKLAEYDRKVASGQRPETSSLEELKNTLRDLIDRIGEKAGATGRTLSDYVSDVQKVMELVDAIEKRTRQAGGGEVDYRTMAVSTAGEIGKELVAAWRDISTSKAQAEAYTPPQPETPAATMQNIIKRQVQNYILQKMKAGATSLNVPQAAHDLGLTPGQIVWAYNQLAQEGWFQVKPAKKGRVKETVQPEVEEEAEATAGAETAAPAEESDQVFKPAD